MPSTVVHVALAGLLAAALLGPAFDRRALVVVGGVTAAADLDVLIGLIVLGGHRAAFHTLLLPLTAAMLLYYDTSARECSWVRQRYDARGVRIAWVTVFAYVVAAIGLDLFTYLGVNVFYPLYDQFFTFTGQAGYAVGEGWVQTFVELKVDLRAGQIAIDAGQRGSTTEVHVPTGFDRAAGPDPPDASRRFPIAFRGWQLLVVVVSTFVVFAKLRLQGPKPRE